MGSYKTGTSTFQTSLFASRDKLIAKGVLYPLTGIKELEGVPNCNAKAHHPWYRASLSDCISGTSESTLNLIMLLKKEIEICNPKVVIISTELLASYKLNADIKRKVLAHLVSMLSRLGSVKICYSVRNSYDWMNSITAQILSEKPIDTIFEPPLPVFLEDIIIAEELVGASNIKVYCMRSNKFICYFDEVLQGLYVPCKIKMISGNERIGVKSILVRQATYNLIDHDFIFHKKKNRFKRRQLIKAFGHLDEKLKENHSLTFINQCMESGLVKYQKNVFEKHPRFLKYPGVNELLMVGRSESKEQKMNLVDDVYFDCDELKIISLFWKKNSIILGRKFWRVSAEKEVKAATIKLKEVMSSLNDAYKKFQES